MERGKDMSFTLSARGGVAAWTWLDHPAGTVGHFVDKKTNVPTNGFYLIPRIDRTGTSMSSEVPGADTNLMGYHFSVVFVQNEALSKVKSPNVDDFVVRSLWNNTHI